MEKVIGRKYKILFICLGNICRSPSAEAVMKAVVEKAGLSDTISIDSAGISGYHDGESADKRMMTHALRRGYDLTSISRRIRPLTDYDDFDLIIGMDDQNIEDLNVLAPREEVKTKIHKMTEFCTKYKIDTVPDPYFGGAAGFELVLDLLEDSCEGVLKFIIHNWRQSRRFLRRNVATVKRKQ